MNVRKPVDYSAMFAALDSLMKVFLTQMELYCEIGKLVSARPEKGAAVAAAEYLSMVWLDQGGAAGENPSRRLSGKRAEYHFGSRRACGAGLCFTKYQRPSGFLST